MEVLEVRKETANIDRRWTWSVLKRNGELIAAVVSGILLLFGWGFQSAT